MIISFPTVIPMVEIMCYQYQELNVDTDVDVCWYRCRRRRRRRSQWCYITYLWFWSKLEIPWWCYHRIASVPSKVNQSKIFWKEECSLRYSSIYFLNQFCCVYVCLFTLQLKFFFVRKFLWKMSIKKGSQKL